MDKKKAFATGTNNLIAPDFPKILLYEGYNLKALSYCNFLL